MALVGSLIEVLGTAISKSVLKFWLKETELGRDTTTAIGDLLGRRLPELRQQRRARRFFERLAEEIADQLQPLFDSPSERMAENEKLATIQALADTFDHAALTDQVLLDHDLSPLRLEDYLRSVSPNATAALNESATSLYSRALREACNYVIEITATLPSFNASATRELLERERESIELLKKILDRIPQSRLAKAEQDPGARFETEYLRQVARRLDQVELFGISLNRMRHRYNLSIAYISLSMSGPDDTFLGSVSRAEELLCDSRRMLIKGEPGSGKTTLLQWLAVNSARQSFESPLIQWNKLIPFYIRLRTYTNGQFPAPEEFISNVARNIATYMPTHWVHGVLQEGRGLILLDGVDELPNRSRSRVRRWIGELIRDFPGNRFVVTSRPSAVGLRWLDTEEFDNSFLQPMDQADIERFLDHWHKSNEDALISHDDDDNVERYRELLRTTIRESVPVRNIARNPLLCAMLCALNLDRKGKIPNDKMELYRLALETLLERRDADREIVGLEHINLSRAEKETLLKDFAYWLLLNGHVDAPFERFSERVANRLKSMAQMSGTSEEIARYLIERSGILREAVVGRVDFLHRTFQEYLAARAAIEENNIGQLLSGSLDDHWRQVIILAAGHANIEQRKALIVGLIERAEHAEAHDAHRILVLAVACRETALELPPDVRNGLEHVMRRLFPPRSELDARYLASAGLDAIPYLKGYASADASTVALCIRTLTSIGDDGALSALEEYGGDARQEVIESLLRGWDFFDQQEYARRILARSPYKGPLCWSKKMSLEGLQHLNALEDFACSDSSEIDDIHEISALSSLRALRLIRCTALRALPDLSNLKKLASISIYQANSLRDMSGLAGLLSLQELTICDNNVLTDLSPIDGLLNLKRLSLQACRNVNSLEALIHLPELEHIDLTDCYDIHDLRPLLRLPKLRTVLVPEASLADNIPFEDRMHWIVG